MCVTGEWAEILREGGISYAQYPVTCIDQLKGGYNNYVKGSVGYSVPTCFYDILGEVWIRLESNSNSGLN